MRGRDGAIYQIEQASIVAGLRKANVRVETRLDGSIAVRYQERYLTVKACAKPTPAATAKAQSQPKHRKRRWGQARDGPFPVAEFPPAVARRNLCRASAQLARDIPPRHDADPR